MTRTLTPLAVLGISICTFASAQAQVCYPAQTYYQAYQPAYSPSQSTFHYQPPINTYAPTVSTYFYTAPAAQAAPIYQAAPSCQPANVVQSYPPMGLLSPTPLLISSDCDGCERIKAIETKIAALRASLPAASSSQSVLQKQIDFHEERINEQTRLLGLLRDNIKELTDVVLKEKAEQENGGN